MSSQLGATLPQSENNAMSMPENASHRYSALSMNVLVSRNRNSLKPRSVVDPPSVGITKNGTVLPEGLSREYAIARAMNTRFLSAVNG